MTLEAVDFRGKQIMIREPHPPFQIVQPPETHEVKVDFFESAPVVWAKLIRNRPEIGRVFFSHYPEHPPEYGYTLPVQGTVSSHSRNDILKTLESGSWPKSNRGDVCAISPTVEVSYGGNKHKLLTFLATDIDLYNTGTNVIDTIDSLRLVHDNWALIHTGNGLHVLQDVLVNLRVLPVYIAGQISMFTRTPDTTMGRFAYDLADRLYASVGNPDKIRAICNEILHPATKHQHPVDLNNMALFLLEAMNASETPTPAGFFRISNKPSRGNEVPHLIAEQRHDVVYKYIRRKTSALLNA